MIKLPPFVNELVLTIINFIGVEPNKMVRSIVISILIVAAMVAVVVVFSLLRSLFRRDKESGDNKIEAQAKAQAINAAVTPSHAEYKRMVHDAIETSLLSISKRIKRLEEKVFSASDDGTQLAETAPPPQAEATQLYDEVQDVVLPQPEEKAEHTSIAPIQDTGIQQPAASPAEEVEHTTIAPTQDTGIEVAPSEQDTGIEQPAAPPEDKTG